MVVQFLMSNLVKDSEGIFRFAIPLEEIHRGMLHLSDTFNDHLSSLDRLISIPTLFIRGSKSDYITLTDQQVISKIFSNASIETIDGAGHWVHHEAPEIFVDIVIKFIKK